MTRDRDAILEELAQEEHRLAEAERTRAAARARLETLRSELAARPSRAEEAPPARPPARLSLPLATTVGAPQTSADKVKLFRALFQGRPDLFPLHFVSKKTGKQGYAPECSNKFKAAVCILKSKGKCTDCTNQAFKSVDDQLIQDHLQGRHVMGVYPLLQVTRPLLDRHGTDTLLHVSKEQVGAALYAAVTLVQWVQRGVGDYRSQEKRNPQPSP